VAEGEPEVVSTFYPGTADRAQAQRVAVRPGMNQAGVDIDLQEVVTQTITGRVVGPDGRGLSGIRVNVEAAQLLAGPFATPWVKAMPGMPPPVTISESTLMGSTSGPDGAFRLSGLVEGQWTVAAASDDLTSESFLSGSQQVTLGRRGAVGVEIQLMPLFDAKIELDWGGTPPPLSHALSVQLENELSLRPFIDEKGRFGGQGQVTGSVEAPVSMWIANLTAGRYRVSSLLVAATLPPTHYLASVRQAGRDLRGEAALLSPTSPALTLVFKQNPGRATGTVEGGAPSQVMLWNADLNADAYVRIATIAADGLFDFSGLPPGTYHVAAFHRVNSGVTIPALNALTQSATRIDVAEGATANVTLSPRSWRD